MSPTSGARLGPYEILPPIGAGAFAMKGYCRLRDLYRHSRLLLWDLEGQREIRVQEGTAPIDGNDLTSDE